MKLVFDYSGVSFSEIMEMDCFTYWQLLRDAVIRNASMTEDGTKWLKKCYAAEQTEPDRALLRKHFGRS